MFNDKKTIYDNICTGLHIDGTTVKPFDVLDTVPRETLQNAISLLLTDNNSN